MKRQITVRSLQLGLLMVVVLLMLGPGQAGGASRGSYASLEREALVKELGLTPEQAKAFQAVGDKFNQGRDGIINEIKNREGDLEKAIAAAPPDEGNIKGLVAAITQAHDQLLQSFKAQRQEEMALLTPSQQGKFILALKKWHQELRENPGK